MPNHGELLDGSEEHRAAWFLGRLCLAPPLFPFPSSSSILSETRVSVISQSPRFWLKLATGSGLESSALPDCKVAVDQFHQFHRICGWNALAVEGNGSRRSEVFFWFCRNPGEREGVKGVRVLCFVRWARCTMSRMDDKTLVHLNRVHTSFSISIVSRTSIIRWGLPL
jgi:hypothetical protein